MSKHHVSKREQTRVLDYATAVLATLRMPKWTVLLMEEPCGDDAIASIEPVEGRYVAQLYLCADWHTKSSDVRRETITHEMLHLVHRNVSTVVLDDSADFMHDHEHDDWSRRVRRELELMVDHLASFMAATHDLTGEWEAARKRARARA